MSMDEKRLPYPDGWVGRTDESIGDPGSAGIRPIGGD